MGTVVYTCGRGINFVSIFMILFYQNLELLRWCGSLFFNFICASYFFRYLCKGVLDDPVVKFVHF